MNWMIRSVIAIFILIFISSCFCPLTSLNPLSDPQRPTYDERIEGAWQVVSEDGGLVFLHFGKGEKKKTEMVSIEHKNNGAIDVLTFTVFSTLAGGQSYLNFNIKELFKEFGEDLCGYTFMRYRFTDTDTLRLSQIDEKPIIEGIKSGKLKGEITYKQTAVKQRNENKRIQQNKKKSIKCVKITDSSDNLIKFFQTVDSKKLFPKSILLKRIDHHAGR
ncbi:MAG: hypothetical protein JSW04_10140 [Desulfobacterales bacterium]|nr:MAG: hypothetical protein JSW04_10140 [Desulfobacterales bacterium]